MWKQRCKIKLHNFLNLIEEKDITREQFEKEFTKIKQKLLKRFCKSVIISQNKITRYNFTSHNKPLQKALSYIKESCLNKFNNNKIST